MTTGTDKTKIWTLRPKLLKLGGVNFGARTPSGIRFQIDYQERPIPVANSTTTIAKIHRVTRASMYWEALETDLDWYETQFAGTITDTTLTVGPSRLAPTQTVVLTVDLTSTRTMTITGTMILEPSTEIGLSRRSLGAHRMGGEFQHDVSGEKLFTIQDSGYSA